MSTLDRLRTVASAIGGAVVLAGLATAVMRLPADPAGVADQARASMPSTGVDQPVTAVLLSYRVYDTWLEVVVVLVAVMVVLLVAQRPDVSNVVSPRRPHPLQARYVHLVAPLLLVVGVFLVSRGTHGVGGAFQGAAVLTGAALLVWLSGDPSVASVPPHLATVLLCVAHVAFVAIVSVTGWVGDPLAYRGTTALVIVVVVETAITVAVAYALAVVFLGGRAAWEGS